MSKKKKELDNKIFWTPDKTITKGRNIMFFIGPRGVGKTYGVKKWCVKQYLKKGEQFCYMRRYESELETISTLFNDFKDNKEFGPDKDFIGYDFKVESTKDFKNAFWVKRPNSEEWEVMGFYMALSTSYHFKATSYPKTRNLIYDEFLYEKGDYSRELKQELNKWFNVLETIFRLSDFRAFMLGNATTFETCYKYGLGLQEPYGSDVWLHKTKPILVEKIDNPKYIIAKKQSLIGQLAEGTEFESYAINNSFIFDSKSFIRKKKGNYRFIMSFYYRGKTYGLYTNYVQCVVDKCDKQAEYVINDKDLDKDSIAFLQRQHPITIALRKYYNKGMLFYQNMEVKTSLHELFQKIL